MKNISLITPFIAAFLTLVISRFNEVSKKCNKEDIIKNILIKTLNGIAGNMLMLNKELLKIKESPNNSIIYTNVKFTFIRSNILNNINKEDLNSFIIDYLEKDVEYFITIESVMEYFNENSLKEILNRKKTIHNEVFEKDIENLSKEILEIFISTDEIKQNLEKLPKLNSFKRKIYKSIF